MAQESEKRLKSIMEKLFHAPKSVPSSSSSSGAQVLRGKKRPSPSSALQLVEPKSRGDIVEGLQHSSASANSPQTPICRPWDRGDLTRRLATFKSMTWFAKPKVVSAVNCARRGWVNVDQDIIACEACGARLLFSTPSSWTQQQVEKAALVFSLKLDNGHKLLCPWTDNSCDETLAQFPPAPPHVLVDKFKERSYALLQLLALPVISSSAIQYMRSPQLEQFLRQNSMLEYGNGSSDISLTESLGKGCEADSANLYHQAQKLISLCGWEPRLLPYVVDCKDRSNQSIKDANVLDSSHVVANGQNPSISVQSASTSEVMEANENSKASSGPQSDPKSVVLDCRLCGASVGLWAFSTVPRPVESFRLVGYADVNSENNSRTYDFGNENGVNIKGDVVNTALIDATSLKERLSNLNMTIAGGPPPTKQNFKATISLPVIGRNLRARFSYDSDFRDRIYVNEENIHSDSIKEDQTGNTLSRQVQPEDMGPSKRHDHGHCSSTSDVQSAGLNHDANENGDTLRKENDNHMTLEGRDATGQGTFSETGINDSIMESPLESTQNVVPGSDQNEKFPENAENVADSIKEDQIGNALSREVQPEDMGLLKRHDHGHCSSTSDVQSAGLNHDAEENDDTLRKENDNHMTLEGRDATGQGTFSETGTNDSIMESPLESTQNVVQGSGQNDKFPENAENVADSIKEDQTGNTLSRQVQPEDIGLSKRHGHGHCSSTSDVQSAGLNHDTEENGDTLGKENDNHMTLEGRDATGEGTFSDTGMNDSIMESPLESTQNVVQSSGQNDKFPENVENVAPVKSALGDSSSHVRNEETIGNDSSVIVASDSCNLQQIPGTDIVCSKESSLASHQELSCVASRVRIPANNEVVARNTGKGLKQLPLDNAMEFDPIRQHRHFCPWIASTGSWAPGWQQTLSALQRQKEFSHPSSTNSPSGSIIKVDDPIASIRNLFTSPSPKRTKLTRGSS